MQELIDREVTLLLLDTSIKQFGGNWLQDKLTKNGLFIAKQIISKQPTIESEPMRHGRWVETEPDEDDRKLGIEFSIKCSRCHDENSHLDFNENHEITGKTFWRSRFCPNCGAKMDLRTPTEVQLDEADDVMMGGTDE